MIFSRTQKTVVLLCALILLVPARSAVAIAQPDDHPPSEDENFLIIASHSNYPPYEYYNPLKGEFEGFNVEILNALAEQMEVKVKYRQMSKVQGLAALRDGIVDGVLGVAYSIERDEFFDFTAPTCTISDAIFIRKDTEGINSTVDLEGRTVAVAHGDFIGEVLQKGKRVHIVTNDSYESALRMLDRGDVAAFAGGQLTGQYLINKLGLDDIKIVGPPIHQVGYCIAVQEENHELVSRLEKALSTIKESGEYDRIFGVWFGKDLREGSPLARFFFWTLGIVVSVLGFAGWMVNRRLRHKVEMSARELAESRTRFQRKADEYVSLFEGANDAIFIINPSDGRFLDVNRKAEELTGYNRAELLQMCMRDIHLPRDGTRVDKRLAQIASEGSASFYDAPMLRKDGSIALVDISASLIEYSGRKVCQSFLRDVSERRLLEKQLVQTEKLASVGTFTAGLAHEIRNPLNSVNLQLLLLERRICDGSKGRESESLQLINIVREEVSRLDNLVTEFLFFAKPLALDCHPGNLHRILDDVFALFHARMIHNGITLERDYVGNLPLLSLDEEKMKQAFINIVQNSIEAMPDGGRIGVSTRVKQKRVILTIEDTGAGIPEEDLDKVFEVFYTSKEKGTGLGLPISLHIIEMHGGTIEIQGKQGVGTTCAITFTIGPAKYQTPGRYSLSA
ncbi:MAG: transporter substrate-binding domain-containing protein [Candidatus Hydrogenedentota bacterium]|nr:MAG: transporter substrate-binding domain-containing protein [Candidatus Hydrogenedentota bacterium]